MERGSVLRLRTRLDAAGCCASCDGHVPAGADALVGPSDGELWCLPCSSGTQAPFAAPARQRLPEVGRVDPVESIVAELREALAGRAVVLPHVPDGGGGSIDLLVVAGIGVVVVHVLSVDGRVTAGVSGLHGRDRRLLVDGSEQWGPVRRARDDAHRLAHVLASDPDGSQLAVRAVVCVPAASWPAAGAFAVDRVLVLSPALLLELLDRRGVLTAVARAELAARLLFLLRDVNR